MDRGRPGSGIPRRYHPLLRNPFHSGYEIGCVALLIVASFPSQFPDVYIDVAQVQTTYSQEQTNLTGFHNEKFEASYCGAGVETVRTWCEQDRSARYRKIGGRSIGYLIADLAAFIDRSPAGGGQAA
jgi:hypothetical protein